MPLFLSKSSMEKAQMTFDFQNGIAYALGEKIPLITTSSEHYVLTIAKTKQIVTKQHSPSTSPVNLKISLNTFLKAGYL